MKGDAGDGSGDGLSKLRDSEDRYRKWWTGGITDIMQEADDGRLDMVATIAVVGGSSGRVIDAYDGG